MVRSVPTVTRHQPKQGVGVEALEQVATGEVTLASRDVRLEPSRSAQGRLARACGRRRGHPAPAPEIVAVAERYWATVAEVLTLLTGEEQYRGYSPRAEDIRIRLGQVGNQAAAHYPFSAGRLVPSVQRLRRSPSCWSRLQPSCCRAGVPAVQASSTDRRHRRRRLLRGTHHHSCREHRPARLVDRLQAAGHRRG